jgi:primosomal protein N' (replication factor Y) (superfamily II helicase)
VRPVTEVLDPDSAVPAELLALCRWVADYYMAPLGIVLRAALPAVLSVGGRTRPAMRTRRVLRIRQLIPSLQQRDELFGRARRQRECFEFLESVGGAAEVGRLLERGGFSYEILNGLVERGVAEYVTEELERDPFAALPPPAPVELRPTSHQTAALAALVDAARTADQGSARDARPFLLHGVTGSGKTLVYIELLREIVDGQGRGAIVLVPEIALTPQTVSRFRAWFGDRVAVLHSALSDGERYDAWRALRSGDRRIAVGARSAVFAPVPDLGAIVVDEEHESTYKQSDTDPRYHAREVAIVRAAAARAVCVLGSATPALESWQNARAGKFRLLELPVRVEGRPLPPVRIIDLRRQPPEPHAAPRAGTSAAAEPDAARHAGPAAHGQRHGLSRRATRADPARAKTEPTILSEPLVDAIHLRLQRGEQTILLLNRRGYATFVQCWGCGAVWECPRCNVSLTFHRGLRRLVCHYCFHDEEPPASCDACGSRELAFRGVGTEQVERAVADRFPAARLARMDVDTTSGRWAHHTILDRFATGAVDILLGTQMIAKGLDFPNVTLVGVVNADVGIHLPDFRASERTFQLLAQVGGRAGRGERGGEVLIQTALPGHYTIEAAVAHDYLAFAERELEERREPGYPPHLRLANIVTSGLDEAAVEAAARAVAEWLGARPALAGGAVTLTGPAPCAVSRIRNRWRWHLLLRSATARALGAACDDLFRHYVLRPGTAELRLAIDRDPVVLL